MTPEKDLLNDLYDIEGLDPVTWWPLAAGWWGICLLVSMIVVACLLLYRRRRKFNQSLKGKIFKTLYSLRNAAPDSAAITTLSEALRHIAMHKYSRQTCAKLEGNNWLKWLTEHDPQSFDWFHNAPWLIIAPYAPSPPKVSKSDMEKAIKAAIKWVK